MSSMFSDANAFNGDISKWDVSSVTDMTAMFQDAESFNIDLSKWDVSKVTDFYMDFMFSDATSFNQNLCGAAWVASKANKDGMFDGSPGSISLTCAPASNPDRELIVRTTIANTIMCPR